MTGEAQKLGGSMIAKYWHWIVILVMAGVIAWLVYDRKESATETDLKIQTIQYEKLELQRKLDSAQVVFKDTVQSLIQYNSDVLKNYKPQYIIQYRKAINPHYDFDFATAADVITKSNYKPD